MNTLRRRKLLMPSRVIANVPIDPLTLTGLQLYLEAGATTLSKQIVSTLQDEPSDGQSIYTIVQPGETFGFTPETVYAQQATLGNRPVLSISGGKYRLKDGSGKSMAMSSSVGLGTTFVCWMAIYWNGTDDIFPLTSSILGSGLGLQGSRYEAFDNDTDPYVGTTALSVAGLHLIRFRASGGHLFVKGTEMSSEEDLGAFSLGISLNTLLGLANVGGTPNAGNMVLSVIASTNSGLAANPPAGIDKAGGYFDVGKAGYGGYGIHL